MNENMRPMTWKELAHENAEQKKTIEQLKKEKEWLINHYAKDMVIDNDRLDDHSIDDFKKEIIEDMQQVLKEGGG